MAPRTEVQVSIPCHISRVKGWRHEQKFRFPSPATSNGACGFPALRFPVGFAPRVMRPIGLGVLSEGSSTGYRKRHRGPGRYRASPYSTVSNRISLRLDVDPSPQVLQIDGRLYHPLPASRVGSGMPTVGRLGSPRALPRFTATTCPSATLSSSIHFPVLPVIGSTLLRAFLPGTRRASPVA